MSLASTQTPPASPAPSRSGPQDNRPQIYELKFHGVGMELAIIVLKNILLAIVTFGLHSFWGRVNVRKFIWHNTEFHGQRLTYHGTGKEMFIGWLKVVGAFLVYSALSNGAMMVSGSLGILVGLLGTLFLLAIVPFAIYQSQRYLMSRTTWRGIRFGMAPNAKDFVAAFISGYFLTIVTFGFYAPVWQNRLYAARMNNTRIGNLEVRYTGTNRQAFDIFLSSLPWMILTLGLYFFWYKAKVSLFRAEHTWIGSKALGAARGHLELTGADYFKLMLVNIVCLVLTLGLAMPWVIAHNLAFFLQRFSFIGRLNFDGLVQVQSRGSASAEGVANIMDVGFGF